VIPLFGGAPPARPSAPPGQPRRPTTFSEEYWADDVPVVDEPSPADVVAPDDEPIDRDKLREKASASLTRSLGRRGLSVSESRARLRADGLTDEESTAVVEEFIERGWLDDTVLAEQLVHSATTRKKMGTRAIRQLLVKRSVARDVIDEVLSELPDDDAERALEFARTKARALSQYDEDTAMRRLMGMLARRGFGGSVAGKAARTALADERRDAEGAGVRFR
jgi:regulatory protein